MRGRGAAIAATTVLIGVLSLATLADSTGKSDTPAAPAAMCPSPGPAAGKATVPKPAAGSPPTVQALRGGGAFAAAPAATMPYELPTTRGKTGREEPVNAQGQVPSTGAKVTFSQHAALGAAYRDYYITMLWRYAAWDFNGHSRDIDQKQFNWFAQQPRLVLVSNPRTGQSITAAAIEAGPGPWVSFGGDRNGPAHHWNGFERGDPRGFDGIVSGFPPTALAALGARTGYPGETGDELIYQWAPDQTAVPGPTSLTAQPGVQPAGAVQNAGNSIAPAGSAGCKPSVAAPQQVSYSGSGVKIPRSQYTTYNGVDWSTTTVQAPTPQVAKAIAAGFRWLGTPYVWGGGGPQGPDHGCARASCLPDTGFDCSGLTSYVMAIGGYSIPDNSAGQRDKTKAIPWSQALPGDLIGYPGHISVYLGTVGGQRLQLEAPHTGDFVKVSVVHRADVDPVVYRWWNKGASA